LERFSLGNVWSVGAMTVKIRQTGAEWLVEVHREPIGRVETAVEPLELAA